MSKGFFFSSSAAAPQPSLAAVKWCIPVFANTSQQWLITAVRVNSWQRGNYLSEAALARVQTLIKWSELQKNDILIFPRNSRISSRHILDFALMTALVWPRLYSTAPQAVFTWPGMKNHVDESGYNQQEPISKIILYPSSTVVFTILREICRRRVSLSVIISFCMKWLQIFLQHKHTEHFYLFLKDILSSEMKKGS